MQILFGCLQAKCPGVVMIGRDQLVMGALLDNPAYTPTRLTGLVAALHGLRSVY